MNSIADNDNSILKHLEIICEALIYIDAKDLSALASMHQQFEDLAEAAKQLNFNQLHDGALEASKLIESIILDETTTPEQLLENINTYFDQVQQLVLQDKLSVDTVLPVLQQTESVPVEASETSNSGTKPAMSEIDTGELHDILERGQTTLDALESELLRLDESTQEDVQRKLEKFFRTLTAEAGITGLDDLTRLSHAVLQKLPESDLLIQVDDYLALLDTLRKVFSQMLKGEHLESIDFDLHFPLFIESATRTNLFAATENIGSKKTVPVAAQQPVEEPPIEQSTASEGQPLTGDRELIAEFVVEATEHLDNAEVQLLTLETDPKDIEAINALFRAFHTIKGVAGFLNLGDIMGVSHEAENLLDNARKDVLVLEGLRIDYVFDSVDTLKSMIQQVQQALKDNGLIFPPPNTQQLIHDLKKAASPDFDTTSSPAIENNKTELPEDVRLGDILTLHYNIPESTITSALEAQKLSNNTTLLGELFVSHSVISRAQLNEALEISNRDNKHRMLGEVLLEIGAINQETLDAMLARQQLIDFDLPKLGEVLVRNCDVQAKDVSHALREQKALKADPLPSGTATSAPKAAVAVEEIIADKSSNTSSVFVRESVKVDATRLDQLVDLVGELVIAESMVAQSKEFLSGASNELLRHINHLDKITRDLQEMATSLRMVPVLATFQKMARLVRDLSKKSQKPVEFIMSGEDTELDKTVVDKIGDPLVHMVRNAVDHGLEASSEERVQNGKPATGRIFLRAFHKGGNIIIEIEDDGRGLNREAIVKKAKERGLIDDADKMSDRDINNLIFEPGFSTAKVLTEISGRGVGMDVVKRNIEALRGQVDIHSVEGKGSKFTIRLPLTLAIIDGMVVRVGIERYILPTLSIILSLRPTENDIHTVISKGEMLTLRGKQLPIIRLHEIFNKPEAAIKATDATIVVVENEGKEIALLLDEIVGQQQIVIKPMGEAFRNLPGIAGAAIMPDGKVGLILDITGLQKLNANEIIKPVTT